jgi:hypothetical protein
LCKLKAPSFLDLLAITEKSAVGYCKILDIFCVGVNAAVKGSPSKILLLH